MIINTDIKDFCDTYLSNIKDGIINDNVAFELCKSHKDTMGYSIPLLKLDAEDMKYLYNKYAKRYIEEMENTLNEIKQSYLKLKESL